MQMRPPPVQIAFGWVQDLRYLPDFGRVEATVMLRPEGGAADLQMITSVAPHPDEAPQALQRRLVLDAVRLLRLCDVGFSEDPGLLAA